MVSKFLLFKSKTLQTFLFALSVATSSVNIPSFIQPLVENISPNTQEVLNSSAVTMAAEGDLIITEIMQNPMGSAENPVSDGMGEWFEVHNTTNADIDMMDMVIVHFTSNDHTISNSLIVPAGGYVILAEMGNPVDTSVNGGILADYDYPASINLGNGVDSLVLKDAGVVIDRVVWDNGATFPDPNGASMSLDPSKLNATDNNNGSNWCESLTAFSDVDLGTPGEANLSCTEPIANCAAAVNVVSDDNCQGMANAEDFNDGSTDPNEDNLTFTVDPEGPYAFGETMVTLTVSDGSESSTCTSTITVDGPDKDEDGVCDAVDLDDDNDGITDFNDCDFASLASISFENVDLVDDADSAIDPKNNFQSDFNFTGTEVDETRGSPDFVADILGTNWFVGADGNSFAALQGKNSDVNGPTSLANDGLLFNITQAELVTEGAMASGQIDISFLYAPAYNYDAGGRASDADTKLGIWFGNGDVDDFDTFAELPATLSGEVFVGEWAPTDEFPLPPTGPRFPVMPADSWKVFTTSFVWTGGDIYIAVSAFNGGVPPGSFTDEYAFFDGLQISVSGECVNSDDDNDPNSCDLDADGDGCVDAIEAGHTDPDGDGILGTSPVTVNSLGLVIGQGGYTGTTDAVTDAALIVCPVPPTAICDDITVTAGENCEATAIAEEFDNGSFDPNGDELTFMLTPEGPYELGVTDVTLEVTANGDTDDCAATVKVEVLVAPPGQYLDLNTCLLTPCPPGTFCPGGTTEPMHCPAGSFQDLEGQTECLSCEAGTFQANEGQTSCTPCPAGSFQDMTGQTECLSCTPGRFQSQEGQTFCVDCPLGTYQSESGQSVCIPCEAGTYGPFTGAIECIDCPIGTSNPLQGQIECTDCEDGTYTLNTSSTMCTDCPADIITDTDPGVCSANVTFEMFESFDDVTVSYSHASGSSFNIGSTEVSFTGEDGDGNMTACTFNVIVSDTEAPTATCEDITISLDSDGQATIAAQDVDGGSTDNCGINSLGVSNTNFGCNSAAYALAFDGQNDFVMMPNDIVSGLENFTFETWVNYIDNGFWTRIFDIGINTQFNMFLTPKANRLPNVGRPRLAITIGGIPGEQLIDANVAMPSGWHHIAVTLEKDQNTNLVTGIMYIDGNIVGQNNNMTLTPSDLGVTTQNLLGKSQYPDPYFRQYLDETRIWSVARTQAQVQAGMNTALSGSEFGLFLYYDYEDGPGSSMLNDKSPSNNDGALMGMDVNTAFIEPGVISALGVGDQTVTLTVVDGVGLTAECEATVTVVDNEPPSAECNDVTVELDSDGMASIEVLDVVSDLDDNCGVDDATTSQSEFECEDLGSLNVITITVTDVNGNQFTCNAKVKVEDNLDPTISCPLEIMVNNDEGLCLATDVTFEATAEDNCGVESITYSPESGSTFDVGTTQVSATATDASGNMGECTFNVIVIDTEAPVAFCEDFTVSLDSDGQATITSQDVDGGSSDNCGDVELSVEPNLFDCDDVGAQVVTLTVNDLAGIVSACEATVQIVDEEALAIQCPTDITVGNDEGLCAADVTFEATAEDNCVVESITYDPVSGSTFDVGNTTEVTATALGANGSMAECTFNVTVIDNEDPVAICEDITIALDQNGEFMLTLTYLVNVGGFSGTDNCGIGATGINFASGPYNCDDAGMVFNRLFAVWDPQGTINTCAFKLTVSDPLMLCNEPPVAVCLDITINADENCQGIAAAAQFDGGSTDSDDDDLTFSADPTGPYALGTTMVTVMVSDGELSDECDAKVTVKDVTPPTVDCPDDMMVNCEDDVEGLYNAWLETFSAEDNCGDQMISTSLMATNSSGLAFEMDDMSDLSSIVINGSAEGYNNPVDVDGKPALRLTQNSGSQGSSAFHNESMTIHENTSFQTKFSFRIHESSGGGADGMTFMMATTPTALGFEGGGLGYLGVDNSLAVEFDTYANPEDNGNSENHIGLNINGSIVSNPQVENTIGQFDTGDTWCAWIEYDGSTDQLEVRFALGANAPRPASAQLTASIDITTLFDIGEAYVGFSAGTGGAVSNHDICSWDFFSCIESSEVTWTSTDMSQNAASCSALFSVIDNRPPVFTCAADMTVECDTEDLSAEALGTSLATDHCSGPVDISSSDEISLGYCSGESVITRTWVFEDNCGNESSCEQEIYLEDSTAPTFTCAEPVTIECDASTDPSDTGTATGSDNCGSVVVSYSDLREVGECVGDSLITRTWTFEDDCENESACVQLITKLDRTRPTIDCEKPAPMLCTQFIPDVAYLISNGNVVAEDNCDPNPTIYHIGPQVVSFGCYSTHTYKFYAVDACGNYSDTCNMVVQFLFDDGAPVLHVENPDHLGCNPSVKPTPQSLVDDGLVYATDGCGAAAIGVMPWRDTAVVDCDTIVTFYFKATDFCNNQSEVKGVEIRWDVNTPIVLECPVDLEIECDADDKEAQIAAWLMDVTVEDVCNNEMLTINMGDFMVTCATEGYQDVTFEVTDDCGEHASCVARISIVDTEGPVITCPDDVTVNADKFFCETKMVDIGVPTITDNCDEPYGMVVEYRDDQAALTAPYPVGVTMIMREVTGECSEMTTTCVQKIKVVDSQPPTVVCKKVIVSFNDDEGEVEIPEHEMYDGVFDNCSPADYDFNVIVSQTRFSCVDLDTVEVNVCATDQYGNEGCCFTKVILQDNFAPIAVCQDVTIDLELPYSMISPNEVDGGSTDNTDECGLDLSIDQDRFTTTGDFDVELTVTDGSENTSSCDAVVTVKNTTEIFKVASRIFLEGAMNSSETEMLALLGGQGLIPLTQPFEAFSGYTGTETLEEVPEGMVDWVIVQVRHPEDPSILLRESAAILMKDGSILDVFGQEAIYFESIGVDMCHVSVMHRNHLSVLTMDPVSIVDGLAMFDFAQNGSAGVNSMKELSTGMFAMWTGDLNLDGIIDAEDRSIAWNMRNQLGYIQGDANLDGIIDAFERTITWNNRNKVSVVPN